MGDHRQSSNQQSQSGQPGKASNNSKGSSTFHPSNGPPQGPHISVSQQLPQPFLFPQGLFFLNPIPSTFPGPFYGFPTPSFNQWTPGPYYASPAGPAFPGHGPAMAQPTGPMYETGTGISMYESQSLNQGPSSSATAAANVQSSGSEPSVKNRVMLGIQKPRKAVSIPQAQASVEDIPKRTNCRLARLPTDAKLGLLECMDAESILRLWGYDQSFRAVLSHPHSNGIWAYLQEASGLRPFTERRRATQQEIEIMKYTLFESCESCSARDAPRQWEWGSRYCHRCLPFKIISRGDFDRTYGPTFKSFPGAIGTITWMNPSRVAGLEGTKLSAEGLEVQDGYTQDKCYIALRQTVQSAVDAISKVVAQKPTSLKELQLQDIKGMIRGEQGRARDLYAARERQEQNIAEIERLGERRSRRVSPLIMGIRGLKLCENDIPSPAHPTWRHLVYRGEELTEVEWVGIKQRLIQLFKANRNMRLAPVLKAVKPPVPSSVAIPKYAYPGDITHLRPGNLPTNVFLNVCAYLDLPTVSTLEKASRDTSSVLRSKKANFVWGSIRRSMGLTMSFKDWPEREFLAYCLGRACSTCGKEGLNIPELVSTLCGNCFQSSVTSANSIRANLGLSIQSVIVEASTKTFANMSWISSSTSKKSKGLVRPAYAHALETWARELSQDLRQEIPDDLLAEHVRGHSSRSLTVAKQCKQWQNARDPDNTRLFIRRSEDLMDRISLEWSREDAWAAMRLDDCDEIVQKPYPFSDREWLVVRPAIAKLLHKS